MVTRRTWDIVTGLDWIFRVFAQRRSRLVREFLSNLYSTSHRSVEINGSIASSCNIEVTTYVISGNDTRIHTCSVILHVVKAVNRRTMVAYRGNT
jgi:hypothetical protein